MNTKDHWKFLGSDVPCGLDPEVDGQRCYLFRTGPPGYQPLRQKVLVIPVVKFWKLFDISVERRGEF